MYVQEQQEYTLFPWIIRDQLQKKVPLVSKVQVLQILALQLFLVLWLCYDSSEDFLHGIEGETPTTIA